ncbi:MAG: hypothetical protein A2Y12_02900 [Planctomycetes bacterium GWF2_42_9]|nr:MAG: hypothetical protein A2Y12_02900 [Planctomycetes bacterium GWF2_42_9]
MNTKKYKKLKICLAASAGGHLTQLLKLAKTWDEYDPFFITTCEAVKNKLEQYGNVYITAESNREHPLKVLKVLFYCLRIILKERPDVVISTGAAIGCVACILGKLIGAKVIWIDSITNVEKLSLSGRLVRPISNLFLAQWQQFAKQYPNVFFEGTII